MLRRLVAVPAIAVLTVLCIVLLAINDVVKWVRDHVRAA